MYQAFYPGQVWLDTNGNPIQAHGGSIFHENGTYYWYGENKEKTLPGSSIWHWGVRMYSSKDLYNWQDEGIICKPNLDDPTSPLHPSSYMDRPHMLYCKETGLYVLWMKIMGKDEIQFMTVATSAKITGPFEILHTLRPCGLSSGDFDLVLEENGHAYIVFEQVHSDLVVADLTPDYTDVTGHYSIHMPRPYPPFVREAPAHFYHDNKHYLFTSGTTGYLPNPSEVAVASSMHGPWETLGDPHQNDARHNSFFSQITSVFAVPDTSLYIALADRWLIDILDRTDIDAQSWFATLFNQETPEEQKEEAKRKIETASVQNTSLARYVWLPVEWQDGKPILRWYDSWKIEDFI